MIDTALVLFLLVFFLSMLTLEVALPSSPLSAKLFIGGVGVLFGISNLPENQINLVTFVPSLFGPFLAFGAVVFLMSFFPRLALVIAPYGPKGGVVSLIQGLMSVVISFGAAWLMLLSF